MGWNPDLDPIAVPSVNFKVNAPLLGSARHMPNSAMADSACSAPQRCLQTPIFNQNFCNAACCSHAVFWPSFPWENIAPAPLPCHRAWPDPGTRDVVKLQFPFQGIPPMISAPAWDAPVRLVRGVHHDPTAARTPIGHVSRNARLFLDFLFQTVFRPQNPLAWQVLGKN